MKRKKKIILAGIVCLTIGILWGLWATLASTTKIAFVNYQVIALGQIAKANDNSFIRIKELSIEELDKAEKYDMIFVNGMGLRITEEQRNLLQEAADNGIPVLTTMATNPANNICSVDTTAARQLKEYLSGGGRRNYRNMLNFVRKQIDGKVIAINDFEAPIPASNDLFYHIDPKNRDNEELGFNTIREYEQFLSENGLMKNNAPHIIITGQMGEPTDLISKLEETGNVVYPVRSLQKLLKDQSIDSINPSAIINMAHGRLGDAAVRYLENRNIPLFSPLNVNTLVEEWENDKMGMNGGFMSQSIVTPEIDGAIRPFALFGHYKDEDGLQQVRAIPERLETFVENVNRYISLSHKPNSEKRIAIVYYKGVGQNALSAAGMEVIPSLFNLLKAMEKEGYKVDNLPSNAEGLAQIIQEQGAIFNSYAEGAIENFLNNCNPELIDKDSYEKWVNQSIRPEKYAEVIKLDGEFPGKHMATKDGKLGLARIEFGNVVLLPQPAAGYGDNEFQIVHGTNAAPPHNYLAAYLWIRYGFKADAMMHFGTHGSLEFTPGKQAALCSNDWPDRLVGAIPHIYLYSIGNVGEGMMAKRRAYAETCTYLTAPFMESNVRGIYKELHNAIGEYNRLAGQQFDLAENAPAETKEKLKNEIEKAALAVKKATVKLGIHKDLELDSILTIPYTEKEIARIENFAEELSNEKMTGQLYTLGIPYENERIVSSVYAMSTDPIAYSLWNLDKLRGKANNVREGSYMFTRLYIEPAKKIVGKVLDNPSIASDMLICQLAGITMEEFDKAKEIAQANKKPVDMLSMMMAMAAEDDVEKPQSQQTASNNGEKNKYSEEEIQKALKKAKENGAPDFALKKMEKAMRSKMTNSNATNRKDISSMMAMAGNMASRENKYSPEEIETANAIVELENTVMNIYKYRSMLIESPQAEINSLLNGLNGGYISPSPGGDPIANPNVLPTGRNLFAINAESTPSQAAWEKGKKLAENTIAMYRQRHNDSLPRKVSYTLWSSEFIETEGATVAQILYMLGVEPIRDTFGRVTDLKLIPSEELGRPRIDVVVQTSGQLRDIAASRLFLIDRAVRMAAEAKDDKYSNMVAEGVVETEKILIEKGITPKDAREISKYRVFGGMNGNYGTGIQGMVQAGDRWDNEKEIADVYLNNMGAYYGSQKDWETFQQFAFEAALTRTDAVVQPRQSNTWGALSLDHVYEFMGGMNLAVRNVTGKDPDAYLSDYRNRNNAKMQEVKEAIGIESRTTILNPTYIKEKMKGGASEAAGFAEIIENTYGWNVMKPKAIDEKLWNDIYDVYVKDKYNLNVQGFFEQNNPAALEQMTAVMLETARKGMWKASAEQIETMSKMHTELVNKYGPSCSGTVCDNAKLREYIASHNDDRQAADNYRQQIESVREQVASNTSDKAMVMKKQELNKETEKQTSIISNVAVTAVVVVAIILIIMLIRHRRKTMQE